MVVPRIAVVGGGPAGCAAAISSALAPSPVNKEVILFELGSIDRDKPCGDALIPDAVEALGIYGLDNLEMRQLDGCEYNNVVTTHDGCNSQEYTVTPRPGWVIRRAVLDKRLRDTAGLFCKVCSQSKVTSLERIGGHFELSVVSRGESSRVRADAVILATGSSGKLAEINGISGHSTRAVAITQYSDSCCRRDALRFDFKTTVRPGYIWCFPVGSSRSNWGVWIPVNQTDTRPLREVRHQMLQLSLKAGYSKPRTALLRMWSNRGRTWHTPTGMVSCGDAAGLVDPYNGEGISAALISGSRAGSAAASFLAGSSTALQEYSGWIESFFTSRYKADGQRANSWMTIARLSPMDFGM
jgi:menaquinone-9 beta-reductase